MPCSSRATAKASTTSNSLLSEYACEGFERRCSHCGSVRPGFRRNGRLWSSGASPVWLRPGRLGQPRPQRGLYRHGETPKAVTPGHRMRKTTRWQPSRNAPDRRFSACGCWLASLRPRCQIGQIWRPGVRRAGAHWDSVPPMSSRSAPRLCSWSLVQALDVRRSQCRAGHGRDKERSCATCPPHRWQSPHCHRSPAAPSTRPPAPDCWSGRRRTRVRATRSPLSAAGCR